MRRATRGNRRRVADEPLGLIPHASRLVEEVLSAIRGTSVAELEVEWDGGRVRLRREPSSGTVRARGEPRETSAAAEPAVVKSTHVGIFRRDPGGGLPQPGDPVAAGQAIAEVETLRIRNAIAAPIDGTLFEVLVADRTPVEYGQPLFVIQPHPPDSGLQSQAPVPASASEIETRDRDLDLG